MSYKNLVADRPITLAIVDLAKAPKQSRPQLRQHVHQQWLQLNSEEKTQLFSDIITLARSGELSPDEHSAALAKENTFSKGAGPAINWFSSVLDAAKPATLQHWQRSVSDDFRQTAEAIRCRKAWGGTVDPFSKPVKPYLKNHAAIGHVPHDESKADVQPKYIGIVGDGLTANITALLILQAMPHVRFRFFEAEKQAGGRMCTYTTPDGVHIEGGAMRLPKSGKTIHHFLRMLGIGRPGEETIPFPNMGSNVSGKILYKGQVVDWHAHEPAPNHPVLQEVVKKFEAFSDTLRLPLEKARAEHDEDAVKAAWQKYINEFTGTSVRRMLREKCGFNDEEIEAFATVGMGTGGLKSYLENNVSALELAREITADLTKGQGLLPNGTTNAVRRLGEYSVVHNGKRTSVNDVAQRSYETKVTKVSVHDKKPSIHYKDARGKEEQEAFDLVLVTPHPGAAKNIELRGALAPELIEAIEQCDMMDSTKLAVQTDFSSMKENIVPVMQSDEEGMNSLYVIKDPNNPLSSVYLDYRWADKVATLQEYFDQTIKVISKISPEMADHLQTKSSALYKKAWRELGGAFRELSARNDWYHAILSQALSQAPDRSVLYANAESILGGYTETAALEAVRAAAKAVTFFGGKVHEDMPVFEQYRYERS